VTGWRIQTLTNTQREGREREGEVWRTARPDPTTHKKAESEKVRYGGLGAARPDPYHTQEKAESEKVRYGGLRVQFHPRRQRTQKGEVPTGLRKRPDPTTQEKAESEKVRYEWTARRVQTSNFTHKRRQRARR
jgi:hypothetical protein